MSISFSSESPDFKLNDEPRVKKWITTIVTSQGMAVGTIGYFFCSDSYLINVNRTYLNHDTFTDIITFDYAVGNLVSGDIMISVERVGENAALFHTSFEQELLRVIIHGIWHLLGQGDKSESEVTVMRNKENSSLALWKTII